MDPSKTSDHLHRGDRGHRAGLRERCPSLLDLATNSTLLDLAADENAVNALRRREDTFNQDVLPPGAKLEAPLEFYSARMAYPLRRQEPAERRKIVSHEASMPLPRVVA